MTLLVPLGDDLVRRVQGLLDLPELVDLVVDGLLVVLVRRLRHDREVDVVDWPPPCCMEL